MESLNRITTSIAAHFEREQDEPFKKMLALKVDSWRSKLVVNSLEKHPEQRKFFRQTLYVPMVEEGQLPDCLPGPVLCKIARSVSAIPSPMRISDVLFDYVGSVDGTKSFVEVNPGTLLFLQSGRYSGHKIFYGYNSVTAGESKIEIFNRSKIPMIRIDGVFDSPTDVMAWNCNSGINCDAWDMSYPVTGDILQMIVQYILQVDFQVREIPDNKEVEVDASDPKNAEPNGKGR